MMQGAWEPLIQKLSAAAYGPRHKNHARCYFWNSLHTMYAAKPVGYALSPLSAAHSAYADHAFALCLRAGLFDWPAN